VNKPNLVLASNSPRRRELLALGGWNFRVEPADVHEKRLPGEAPRAYVLRLAEAKARACADPADPNYIFIGADTDVVDGQAILGKPQDEAEAAGMLRRLRGRTHQVYSGIAVYKPEQEQLVTDLCVTEVPMRQYNDEELEAYAASGDPLDKAGAYAIQHAGFHPVEGLAGCYASVMGLPLCHLTRSLRKLGVEPETDISAECQAALSYACPVSVAILRGEMVG
jgi:septum formation protein